MLELELSVAFLLSTILSLIITSNQVTRTTHTGKDINKPDTPEIPESGGIAIAIGVMISLLVLAFNYPILWSFLLAFAIFCTFGLLDDIYSIKQFHKFLLPAFIGIILFPVLNTTMAIPFIGQVELGIIYLFLVMCAMTAVPNLTNMLAGFNGLESGMGIVLFTTTAIIGMLKQDVAVILISYSMLGALLSFWWYNKYPSRIFIGDVGTFAIGGAFVLTVIIGKIEVIGFVMMLPYIADFGIKAMNRFPSKGWQGIYDNGKLYAPEKPVSLCQYIMKYYNGITEEDLVGTLTTIEILLALIVLVGVYYGVF